MPPTVAPGYARAYQAQAVLTASPGQLILMLYDGALRFLGHARDALQAGEENPKRIEIINTNLVKAQNIIAELQACLNHDAGGEHSRNLDRLYDYYLRRLFEANLRKQPAEMLRTQEAGGLHNARGVA
jgi:flagellar secretion chaperone FliS